MLKDITLGQYFPGDTIVHRLDPRTKIILVLFYIIALFTADSWVSYGLVLVVSVICQSLSRIRAKNLFKGLKPMLVIITLPAVLNIFYTTGTPVLPGWIITWEGIARAVKMVLRIVLLITGTFLLTYTTSPIALTDGLEILLNPLTKLKVPIVMMMSIRIVTSMARFTIGRPQRMPARRIGGCRQKKK